MNIFKELSIKYPFYNIIYKPGAITGCKSIITDKYIIFYDIGVFNVVVRYVRNVTNGGKNED